MPIAPTTAVSAPGTASRLIGSLSTTPDSAATNSGCVHTSATLANVEVRDSEVIQLAKCSASSAAAATASAS